MIETELGPTHFDVDARNNFQPPRYFVAPLAADTDEGWSAVAPVCLLVDTYGEEASRTDARIQLAYDRTHLYLRARVVDDAPTIRPDVKPDSPRFWRQDHIEFRLGLKAADQYDQTQFIISAGGEVLDSKGVGKQPGALATSGPRLRAVSKIMM